MKQNSSNTVDGLTSSQNGTKPIVSTSTFRNWEVYEVLPLGWKVDNSCGSPLHGYDFCTDGKSILKGGKRALVKSIRKGTARIKFVEPAPTISKMETTTNHIVEPNKMVENKDYIFPAKTVNDLARLKFKQHLLQEIYFDLMVCEIEGWNKKEYINELKKLINSIDTSNKKNIKGLPNLFSDVGL